MKSLKFYQEWLEHDGRVVKIDGLNYRLRVRTFQAIYPSPENKITVYATPVNKNSKYYQEVKRQLGDDWSTDVLDSSLELQADILNQIAEQNEVEA